MDDDLQDTLTALQAVAFNVAAATVRAFNAGDAHNDLQELASATDHVVDAAELIAQVLEDRRRYELAPRDTPGSL